MVDEEQSIWDAVILVVAAAALVAFAASVLQGWAFPSNGSWRNKLENAALGANVYEAFLPLAVIALARVVTMRSERTTPLRRWAVGLAVVVSAAIAMAAVYSIWDALTISSGPAGIAGSEWAARSETILGRIAALAIAAVALVVAVRPRLLVVRPRHEQVPLRRRDWPDPWAPESKPDDN